MLIVVSYDVKTTDPAGRRRLRRIARACQDHGQRVQFSIFECEVTPAAWAHLRQRLVDEMDRAKDSLRFYFLGADGKRRIEHIGAKVPLDLDGPIMI